MQRNPRLPGLAAAALIIIMGMTAGPALAHIQLTCPPARYAYSATGIKMGPCGASSGTKSNMVTHLTAGQSLMVTFTETVYHPGFFRISVDTSGMDKFPAISSTPMTTVMAPVIADNIFPHTSGSSNAKRSFMVTIPNTPCAKCQLQLTQFMSDNPSSGYYECADIVIDDAATGTPYACGGGGALGGGGRMGGGSGGRMGGGGSAGPAGSGGATGSGGASATGSGGGSGSGSGGSTSSGSGGSASGGSSSGGSASGGVTGSGGMPSASGGKASGGSSSGGSGSGGSGSGGSIGGGSGGSKGPGGNDDGAGGCAYAAGAPVTDLSLVVAAASLALALSRRRRSQRCA